MSVRDPAVIARGVVGAVLDRARRLRLMEIAPTLAEGACIVALGWVIAGLVWQGVESTVSDDGGSRTAMAGVDLPARAMPADNRILRSFDPFQRDSAGAATAVADAPETSLDLKLYGVRAGAGPNTGSAVLATPDDRQQTFSAGQTVFQDVRLIAIYPDRVLLERGDGRQESLYLSPDQRRRRQETAASPDTAVPPADSPDLSSPAAIMGALSLQPALVDGRIQGLRIGESANATLLQRNGLKAGDVLVEIEGRSLDSIGRLDSVAASLRDADSVTLTIMRDGQKRRLTLDLNRKR